MVFRTPSFKVKALFMPDYAEGSYAEMNMSCGCIVLWPLAGLEDTPKDAIIASFIHRETCYDCCQLKETSLLDSVKGKHVNFVRLRQAAQREGLKYSGLQGAALEEAIEAVKLYNNVDYYAVPRNLLHKVIVEPQDYHTLKASQTQTMRYYVARSYDPDNDSDCTIILFAVRKQLHPNRSGPSDFERMLRSAVPTVVMRQLRCRVIQKRPKQDNEPGFNAKL